MIVFYLIRTGVYCCYLGNVAIKLHCNSLGFFRAQIVRKMGGEERGELGGPCKCYVTYVLRQKRSSILEIFRKEGDNSFRYVLTELFPMKFTVKETTTIKIYM